VVALAFCLEPVGPVPSLSDRVLRLLERVDFRRADTPAERDAVFRLRYAAYLREGTIAADPSERFADRLDTASNAFIFGVYIDGELAGSIRLHIGSKMHPELPALGTFADVLAPDTARGSTIVDPTRLAADRAALRRYPELCYVTTRLAVLGSEYFNANLLLATVRAEHQAFYRRVFGHRLVCEPRQHPSFSQPISLMALDYPVARERLLECHPFLHSTVFERRMLFARPAHGTPRPPHEDGRRQGGRRACTSPAPPASCGDRRTPRHARRRSEPRERDLPMSADGTWKLVMQTPIGERKSTLTLREAGGALTGRLAGEDGNATDIFDGTHAGGALDFKAAIKNPMPLTLVFSGRIDADKISGNVSASGVGSWPFSGERG